MSKERNLLGGKMWHGVFPPYMGELAHNFIVTRQSPLASLLTENVVYKL